MKIGDIADDTEGIRFPLSGECPRCKGQSVLFNLQYVWGRDTSAEASYYCAECRIFSFVIREVHYRKSEGLGELKKEVE